MNLEEWRAKVRNCVQVVRKMRGRLGCRVEVGWPDGARERPAPRKAKRAAKLAAVKNPGPMEAEELNALQGPTLASVAKLVCYGRAKGPGYPAVPARNFVKVMEEHHSVPVLKVAAQFVRGERPAEAVGMAAKGAVQRAIRDSDMYKPLAPSTVKRRRKGSARPLIDTGTMLNDCEAQATSASEDDSAFGVLHSE